MRRVSEPKNKIILTLLYVAILIVFWTLGLPCPYRYFFDIECIGCGMSRAYFSLLQFDFSAAFNYHPMFWSVPIVYLYFLFDGKVLNKKLVDYTVLAIIGGGFLINWIAKLC